MPYLARLAQPRLPNSQILYFETYSVFGCRIVIFFVFVGIFSVAYQIGSMLEITEEEAAEFMEMFEELIRDIDDVGIFLHNTTLALPMFLPGFGIVWGVFSATSTGYAFAAISYLTPELRQIPPLAILYLTPFGVMELTAYSLATSRSYILLRAIIRKTDLLAQAKPTAIEIGIVVGLLLAGGILEYYMINLTMEEGTMMLDL